MSGLATKKFTGSPAAAALLRKVALPINPLASVAVVQPAALLHMKPQGLGLRAARKPRKAALVQLAPVYAAALPALPAAWPLKCARKIGSGTVPAPVCANVAPRPAA